MIPAVTAWLNEYSRQGQGDGTILKEWRFASGLRRCMQIADGAYGTSGYSFWVLDANSGAGWNVDVEYEGSPLVIIREANASLAGLRPRLFFCDHDPTAIAALHMFLNVIDKGRSACEAKCCDNEEGLEYFARCIRREERPKFAVGAVIIDPNGYFYRGRDGTGVPIAGLLRFVREFPKIDIIVNFNTSKYHMDKNHPSFDLLKPSQVLTSLNKKYWLVGETQKNHRFLFAIGRNVKTGGHKSLGIYDIDSPEGREIMFRADNGRRPDPVQPSLFGTHEVTAGE